MKAIGKLSYAAAIFAFIVAALAICAAIAAPKTACVQAARADAVTANTQTATLTMIYDKRQYTYNEEHIEPPDFTIKEEFEERKINAPISEKVQLVQKLVTGGADIKDAMLYCFPRLREVVDEAANDIKLSPTNAEIRFNPKARPMFEISKSVPGYYLNETRVYNDILYAFSCGMHSMAIVPTVIKPSVHESDLTDLTEKRASFTTSYARSTSERKHNIKISLDRINGYVIEPGETFSFNKVVGKRNAANGFMTAKIIFNGQYIDGIGGGVCQASTTVYNCALRAGLKMVSVSHHSLVPSYVSPSFDAMVNGSWSDLKFSNPYSYPVFLRTVCTDETITVEAYTKKLPYAISTESVVTWRGEVPPPVEFLDTERKYTSDNLPGEKVWVSGGSLPLKSEGYLIYTYENGTKRRQKIRTDTYSGTGAQIAITPSAGTAPAIQDEADIPDDISLQ